MEINLRNVPFSEELVFFIRRCAGESRGVTASFEGDLEVRVAHVDIPSAVYEVRLALRCEDDADIVIQREPDAFLAVRNAFEILKARHSRKLRLHTPSILDVAADAHT